MIKHRVDDEEYIKNSIDNYEAKMKRGSEQRERFLKQQIDKSHFLNEKSESKIF